MSDLVRLERLEVIVEQHDDLIARCVVAMEQQIKVDERLANHLEESKRQWTLLDEHTQRLAEMNQQVAEMLTFYHLVRRLGWGLLVFLSGGLIYLIKFWADNYGAHTG